MRLLSEPVRRRVFAVAHARRIVMVGAPTVRAALTLAAAGAAGLPLLSAAGPDRGPPLAALALLVLAALSVWRPGAGLVAATALIPMSRWLGRAADLHALRLAEGIVLAVLAGTLVRLAFDARRRDDNAPDLPPALGSAAVLLAATAAASAAVELAVAQAGRPGRWPLATVWAVLSDGYLSAAPTVPGLTAAALLIEGAALLLVVVAWSRREPELPRRLAVATLAGAAGAAAINAHVMLADLRAADSAATPAGYLRGGHRLAGHVGDVNATGSYFLLAALTGLGLAAGRDRARRFALPLLAAGAACWLSGSRTALAAAAVVGLAAGAHRLRTHRREMSGRLRLAVAGALAAAVLALPLTIVVAYPDRGGVAAARDGLDLRVEFTARSLRMWAAAPVFGVGAGRYYALSDQYAADSMPPRWRRENAHNNFLQIAAELGAVGILAFLGLLAAGALGIRKAVRARHGPDPLVAGAGAGAGAFLLTCLAGHPLLTSETAYPFWIVLALAVAQARQALPPPPPGRPRQAAAGWAAVLFLLTTLPFRADAAVRGLTVGQPRSPLDELRGGTYAWDTERGGPRFRWSGPRASFLLPGETQAVRIPLRALHAGPDRPVTVSFALGGQPMTRVRLADRNWTELAMRLAEPPGRGLHRLDLAVDPPWPPRERRNGDGRILGIKVGVIELAGGGPP